jgi:hypothetical protein
MSLVKQCSAPGCETLTMGSFCIEHEHVPLRVFVRGRPLTGSVVDRGRPLSAAVPTRLRVVRRASEPRLAVPHLR